MRRGPWTDNEKKNAKKLPFVFGSLVGTDGVRRIYWIRCGANSIVRPKAAVAIPASGTAP